MTKENGDILTAKIGMQRQNEELAKENTVKKTQFAEIFKEKKIAEQNLVLAKKELKEKEAVINMHTDVLLQNRRQMSRRSPKKTTKS